MDKKQDTNKNNALTILEKLKNQEEIPIDQLNQAIKIATETNTSILETLATKKIVSEESLLNITSQITGLPFEKLNKNNLDPKIAGSLPEEFARKKGIIPLFSINKILTIATHNPFDLIGLEETQVLTKSVLNLILCTKTNVESLLNTAYAFTETMEDIEEVTSMSSLFEMGMKLVEEKTGSEEEKIFDIAQEAPIAKLVDTILKQSLQTKASDIHIEPEEKSVKIRFRIDGLLKDMMTPPKTLETAIVSRIKILSNLDITETRKPQDGRLTYLLKDKEIDFRVSTIRTISGEKIVLRVLDKSGAFVSIEKLGLSEVGFERLEKLINASSGIVIVCGPTGSGKTSSLYSVLSKINTSDQNIITIEDPVEYNLDGINQIPVNPKIGVDFVTGLKSIVRQDPDIIMVGEVRDIETASISIQAALTGHMVFTTLHTRNAAGSVTRLMDMGVAPFLLNSSINGVIAQRLIRTICASCKEKIDPKTYTGYKHREVIKLVKKKIKNEETMTIYKGKGCKICENTGYKGRTGIFEVMIMNTEIGDLILEKSSSEKIHVEAVKEGMITMLEDGIEKIVKGITSIEEVARVLDI